MRFTSSVAWLAATIMIGTSASVFSAEPSPLKLDHVRTVEDLLAAEAALLQQRSKPLPEQKLSIVATPANVDDVLSVDALWGYSGAKRALVSVNGVRSTVAVGESVGKYTVRHIGAGCVALESSLPIRSKAKALHNGQLRRGDQQPPSSRSPMQRLSSKTVCFSDGGHSRTAPVVAGIPLSTGAASPLPTVAGQVAIPTQPVQATVVAMPK